MMTLVSAIAQTSGREVFTSKKLLFLIIYYYCVFYQIICIKGGYS